MRSARQNDLCTWMAEDHTTFGFPQQLESSANATTGRSVVVGSAPVVFSARWVTNNRVLVTSGAAVRFGEPSRQARAVIVRRLL